jgi:hypothetical protein
MEGVENERVVVKFERFEGVRTSLRSGWQAIRKTKGRDWKLSGKAGHLHPS